MQVLLTTKNLYVAQKAPSLHKRHPQKGHGKWCDECAEEVEKSVYHCKSCDECVDVMAALPFTVLQVSGRQELRTVLVTREAPEGCQCGSSGCVHHLGGAGRVVALFPNLSFAVLRLRLCLLSLWERAPDVKFLGLSVPSLGLKNLATVDGRTLPPSFSHVLKTLGTYFLPIFFSFICLTSLRGVHYTRSYMV